jgi:hypothetical protein
MNATVETPGSRTRRDPERGGALIVVMIILTSLIAGTAIALYVQLNETKGSGLVRQGRDATYCAEAGLAAARGLIAEHQEQWNAMLDGNAANDPAWYPIVGDVDGDGGLDYQVIIRDNDDEAPPTPLDPRTDNDLVVFVVSRCTKWNEVPREIMEMVFHDGAGAGYRNQSGQGAANTGNAN